MIFFASNCRIFLKKKYFWIIFIYTAKLGYNELGCNEHSVKKQIFQPQMLIYYTNHPGYNEPVPSCSL